MDFEKFYNENLLPEIKPLEDYRNELIENFNKNPIRNFLKKHLGLYILLIFCTFILFFASFFTECPIFIATIFIFLIIEYALFFSFFITKNNAVKKYKLKVKETILKKYLDIFGRFTLLFNENSIHEKNSTTTINGNDGLNNSDYTIKLEELINLGIADKKMIKNDDDIICGQYKNHQICLNDTHFCTNNQEENDIIFRGLIRKIYLRNNHFPTTCLIPKNLKFYNKKLNKFSNNFYDIYTNNEGVANQFFENLHEKFKNFENSFLNSSFQYCLNDNIFYFLIHNENNDFFDFSDLDNSLLDIEIHRNLFNELKAIFDLFDYLIENKII